MSGDSIICVLARFKGETGSKTPALKLPDYIPGYLQGLLQEQEAWTN